MSLLKLFPKSFSSAARIALMSATFLVSTQGYSQDILDVNIGFPKGTSPVSFDSQCLLDQVLYGRTTIIFPGAAVEPTLAVNPVNPKFIVACWQNGRISNGGSLEAGIAYSKNGGKNWKQTTVPLQICEGGINQRITDVWLSYSSDGSTLYLSALGLNATLQGDPQQQVTILSSISKDNGSSWSTPTVLDGNGGYANEPTGLFPVPDKNSVTADRNHPKKAYAVWDTFPETISFHSDSIISRTTNGGKTWTPAKIFYNPFPDLKKSGLSNGIYNDCQTIDNIILVQPKGPKGSNDPRLNGDILNTTERFYATPNATDSDYQNDSWPYQYTLLDIVCVRSKDQGVTWDKTATIIVPGYVPNAEVFTGGYKYKKGQLVSGIGTHMRTGSSVPAINSTNGNLYYPYQTGQFRADQLPQIGLVTSRDGGYTWTEAVQVNRTPSDAANPQAFTPSVAVTEDGYVGILYFDFRKDNKSNPDKTKMDAWLAIYVEVDDPNGGSTGIGLDFVREVRLSTKSYIAQNGPTTTQGVMTDGDYEFLVAQGKKFYACYTKSFNGPFSPPITLVDNPFDGTKLLLDNNYRAAPFFSVVKP